MFADFQKDIGEHIVGENARSLSELQEIGHGADHPADASGSAGDQRVDFVSVHEFESGIAHLVHERRGGPLEERMGQIVGTDEGREVLM